MTSHIDPQEEILWVERAFRYITTFELSIDPFRQGVPHSVVFKLYEEETEEWRRLQMVDPRLRFTPGDRQAQEAFYQNLDTICATFDSVKKDDWKTLFRISSAAQTGAWFILIGDNQFLANSAALNNVKIGTTAKIKIWGKERMEEARRKREAALWSQFQGPKLGRTNPQTLGSSHTSPGLNLKIDESVTYLHPETKKVLKFVVLGFRRSKQGGMRYTVAYADNDDVEVELNEGEMRDVLSKRVSAEDPE